MTVEMDYDYLKSTVENFVPYFSNLEAENQTMAIQLRSKTVSAKIGERERVRSRKLEQKLTDTKKDTEKKIFHLESSNKQLEEKVKMHRSMNLDLQKKVTAN